MGACYIYTPVTDQTSDTNWSAGWYVVEGNVTISGKLSISASEEVHLILCDGASLNVGGIQGEAGSSLTVYAQSSETLDSFKPGADTSVGALTVGSYASLPGNKINASISVNTLTVHGGTISATAGDADGVSIACDVGTLTMSGGTLTAKSGTVAKGSGELTEAGISVGVRAAITVTVSGGTIIAKAGEAYSSKEISCLAFSLSGTGTVKSSQSGNDDAVRLTVRTDENENETNCSCTISGGTIRLAESSFAGTFTLAGDVKPEDVLADGYCFADASSKPLKRTEASGAAKKVVLHKQVLDGETDIKPNDEGYYNYYHKPSECTASKCDYCSFECNRHSYDSEKKTGKCEICGYACLHSNANFANGSPCAKCGMGCPHASVDPVTGKCTVCQSTENAAVAKVDQGASQTQEATTTYYASFNVAVAAANSLTGEKTLTLLQDCTSADATVSSQIKLVLNDKTLTLDEGAALTVAGSGSSSATLKVVNAANDEDLRPNTPGAGKLDGTVELTTEKSFLRVYSGEITTLQIDNANATSGVQLYGGKYGTITIGNDCALTLADLLASGYAYRTTDSWVTSSTEKSLTNVSVQAPPISNLTTMVNNASATTASVVLGYAANSAPTLSVTASVQNDYNSANITYQWCKVTDEGTEEISGATDSTYTIETDLGKGTYKYVCKATLDGYTRTSAEITVTVTNPSITESDITAPTAKTDLTYNNAAQELITEGSGPNGTTMKYRLGTDGGWKTSASDIKATDAGDYTVYWYIDGGTNYNNAGSEEQPNSVTCTINKMKLVVSSSSETYVTVNEKTYDGTTAATASVSKFVGQNNLEPSLTLNTDYTVSATFADANVGTSKTVTVIITLTEEASENYCFVKNDQQSASLELTCTASITRATAPTASAGSLTVYNGLAHEYTYDFSGLLPTLDGNKSLGETSYSIKSNTLSSDYFESVSLSESTATLKVKKVDSAETGSLGKLVVTVTSQNYNDFDLTLNVSAANQLEPTGSPTLSTNILTLGQPLNTITLSGSMTGPNNEAVEGTFAWDDPDSTPAVGPQTPGWTFTPTDTLRYKTVTGTAQITVKGTATATKEGSLTVYTKLAHTYTFDFKTLLPELTYGTTTYKIEANKQDEHYKLDTVYFPSGNVSLNETTGVVTLKAEKIASTVEDSLGKLIVTVSSTNYYDFELTLNVASANQIALTGAPTYTPIRTSGKTLADAALTRNTAWPLGELAWVDAAGNVLADTTRVDANKAYTWRFTPTDLQYATLTGSITLYSSSPYIPSIKPTTPEITFTDVPQEAYYADAVRWAVENDVTTGVGGGKFDPNASCTRAQIVTFLWRAAGQPQPKTAKNPFTDVAEQDYFYTAVLWAVENGITTGTTATTFSPGAVCTRAQTVTFLFRFAAANGMDAVTLQELLSAYPDSADVPGYAVAAFNWALAAGLVQGAGGRLLPNAACSRAQLVTLLFRLAG